MSRLTFKDPPVRRLVWLALAAAVSLVGAIVALALAAEDRKASFVPEAAFSDLAARTADIRAIVIKDKTHETRLAFAPEAGWTVPGDNGAPARIEAIEILAGAMIAMTRTEKRTALAKWHERVGLTDPGAGGEGRLVRLLGADDQPIAEILLGETVAEGLADGTDQVYARAPDEPQVYIVRGPGLAALSADPAEWSERLILDVPASRLARADVAPATGQAFAVVRPKAEDVNFAVEAIPESHRLRSVTAANSIGAGLAELRARELAEAGRIAFDTEVTRIVYQTYDGLVLTIELQPLGNDTWARLNAAAKADASARAKREAEVLSRRFAAFVYLLEGWKANQLATSLDQIIEPVAAAE